MTDKFRKTDDIDEILVSLHDEHQNIKINKIDYKIKNITQKCFEINNSNKISLYKKYIMLCRNIINKLLVLRPAYAVAVLLLVFSICIILNNHTQVNTEIALNIDKKSKKTATGLNNLNDVKDKINISRTANQNTAAALNPLICTVISLKGATSLTNGGNEKTLFEKQKHTISPEKPAIIKTNNNSKCRLTSNCYFIDVNADSFIEITRLNALNMKTGKAFFNFERNLKDICASYSSNNNFIINTPDVSIKITGTVFNVSVSKTGTKIDMLEGKVEIEAINNLQYKRSLSTGEVFQSSSNTFTITNDKNIIKEIFTLKNNSNKNQDALHTIIPGVNNNINITDTEAILISNKKHKNSSESACDTTEKQILNNNNININITNHSNGRLAKQQNYTSRHSSFIEEQQWLDNIKISTPDYYNSLMEMTADQRYEIYIKNKKASDILNNIK